MGGRNFIFHIALFFSHSCGGNPHALCFRSSPRPRVSAGVFALCHALCADSRAKRSEKAPSCATKLTTSSTNESTSGRKSAHFSPACASFIHFCASSLCRRRTIAPGTRLSARKTPQLLPKKPTTFRRKSCSFRQNKRTFYSYLPSPLFVSCICANFEATSPISCAHENHTRLRFSPPTRRGDALHARRICGTPQPNHRSALRATLGALR